MTTFHNAHEKNKIKENILNWVFFQVRRKYEAEETDLTYPTTVFSGGQASWEGNVTEMEIPLRGAMAGS